MATIALAQIYEKQGHVKEALNIYRSLLGSEDSLKAKSAVQRLTNSENLRVKFFVKMTKKDQFEKFERWLVSGWN